MKPGAQHGMRLFPRNPLLQLLFSGVLVGVVSSASDVPRRATERVGALGADLAPHTTPTSDKLNRPSFVALKRRSAQGRQEPITIDEDTTEDVTNDADKVFSRVANSPRNLRKQLGKQHEYLKDTFMPEFRPKKKVFIVTLVLVGVNLLWFIAYFHFLYVPDFNETHHVKTDQETKDIIAEQEGKMLFGLLANNRFLPEVVRPDMIIVFHNPGIEPDPDKPDEKIKRSVFNDIFANRGDQNRSMEKFRSEDLLQGSDEKISKVDARAALLQDFYASLPKMGFDSEIFRSMNGTKLFACVTLSQEDWIENYFMRYKVELQVQDDVVERLGLGNCEDMRAASPPFIRYDPLTVQQLYERNVVDKDHPNALYKKNLRGHIANTQERFRIIHRQIGGNINLSRALKEGLIVDWYPVHNLLRLQQLGAMWASLKHLSDLTFKQPLSMIQGYFGSQVAISLAWRGFYCKALLALVPAALLWQVLSWFSGLMPELHDYVFRQILSWAIVIILWSKIVANMWDREEEYFLNRWNVHGNVENTVRSAFVGELKPSPVDDKMLEVQVPHRVYWSKCLASGLITVVLCLCMAIWIFLWVSLFKGKMTHVATILLVVQIKIFDFTFNWIAIQLNKWENHKYREEYYSNLLWKVFAFQMVNQYWPFIYLSVQQRRTEYGCPTGGCLLEIRFQLTSAMFVLAIASMAQVAWRSFVVRLCLWWEERSPSMPAAFRRIPFGGSPSSISVAAGASGSTTRSFVEEQAKYGSWDIEDQVMSMVAATTTLGYVILFGAVAPMVVPMAFCVLMIELRGAAFYLTTHARRPVPAMALGKSACQRVVHFLMLVGLFWSGILLAEFGYLLRNEAIISKVTFAFLFMIGMVFVWALVDLVFPTSSPLVRLMVQRRIRVNDCIAAETAEAVEAAAKRAAGESSKTLTKRSAGEDLLNKEGHGEDDTMVDAGQWDKIESFAEKFSREKAEAEEMYAEHPKGEEKAKAKRALKRLAYSLGSVKTLSTTSASSPGVSERNTPRQSFSAAVSPRIPSSPRGSA